MTAGGSWSCQGFDRDVFLSRPSVPNIFRNTLFILRRRQLYRAAAALFGKLDNESLLRV